MRPHREVILPFISDLYASKCIVFELWRSERVLGRGSKREQKERKKNKLINRNLFWDMFHVVMVFIPNHKSFLTSILNNHYGTTDNLVVLPIVLLFKKVQEIETSRF